MHNIATPYNTSTTNVGHGTRAKSETHITHSHTTKTGGERGEERGVERGERREERPV